MLANGGSQAAVQWQLTGTNTGPFQAFPPSGKPVNIHGTSFFHLQDDQIQSAQMYFDARAFTINKAVISYFTKIEYKFYPYLILFRL